MGEKPFEIDFVFLGSERPSLDLFEEVQKGFRKTHFRGGLPVSPINPETGVSKWLEYVKEHGRFKGRRQRYMDRHLQLFHIVPTKDCKMFMLDEEGKNLEPYMIVEKDRYNGKEEYIDVLKLSKDYDALYIPEDFLEEKRILKLVGNGYGFDDNMTEGLFMNKDKFMVLDDEEYEEYKKYPAEYENKMRTRKCLQKREVEEKIYNPWDIDFVNSAGFQRGMATLVEEKFEKVKNDFSKPLGGLWTSPLDHSAEITAWDKWAIDEENYGLADRFDKEFEPLLIDWDFPNTPIKTDHPGSHIVPTSDCKLLIVDRVQKVMPYIKKYEGNSWIDFEKLSCDYDAVYFPQEVVDKFNTDVLCGWDAATCFFMSKDKFMILKGDDYVEYRQNPKEYEEKMLYEKSWRHKENEAGEDLKSDEVENTIAVENGRENQNIKEDDTLEDITENQIINDVVANEFDDGCDEKEDISSADDVRRAVPRRSRRSKIKRMSRNVKCSMLMLQRKIKNYR